LLYLPQDRDLLLFWQAVLKVALSGSVLQLLQAQVSAPHQAFEEFLFDDAWDGFEDDEDAWDDY